MLPFVVARWWCVPIVLLLACGREEQPPLGVPFDKLDLVLRLRLEPGPTEGPRRASDDGSSTWVEAFDEPDRGWGIFLAEAGLTVTEPERDADGLLLDELSARLLTDEYTANGWLAGARLDFRGAGRAELSERRSEQQSYWAITEMPPLVLSDAAGTIQSEFDWISEALTAATISSVWLDTGEPFPSVYLQFVQYRRVRAEGEP